MTTGMRFLLAATGLTSAVLLGTAVPAGAATAPLPDPTPITVTVSLRPQDPARLAAASRLGAAASVAHRRAALAAAGPRAGAGDRVTQWLRRNGFTVTGRTGTTVTARGTAARAVDAFGTRLRRAGAGRYASHRAAVVPADLRADVLAVSGLDTRARWSHRGIPFGHTPTSLRQAYDVTRAGSDGDGTTIATVQFNGWRPADLTTYANAAGITMPPGSPVTISVNGAATLDNSFNNFEVALDQEVLLAAAPAALQRVYVAPNTTADAVALYAQIASDVSTHGIDVVSTSWGNCEANVPPGDRTAIETQLANILAAGATLFAASGDMGAYGCSSEASPNTTLAVDYPASSVSAVGVGGTKLTGSGSSWTETAWNDPVGSGGFAGYGSGGGASSSVARPSWQSSLSIGGSNRLVPDVSAVGDPETGIGVFAQSAGGWVLGGGTSASAPLWAGHLAAALSSGDRTTGIGAIHERLYANPAAFRDITSGNNFGFNAGAGYDQVTGLGSPLWSLLAPVLLGDPVVTAPYATTSTTVPLTVTDPAGTGFTSYAVGEGSAACTATGSNPTPPTQIVLADGADRAALVVVSATMSDGSCRYGRATVRLDRTNPTATGSMVVYAADARTVLNWGGSDALAGVGTWDVELKEATGVPVWSLTGTSTRTIKLTLKQGWTYRLYVTAIDRAGNRSAQIMTYYAVPLDDASFQRSAYWNRQASPRSFYGGHSVTRTGGAWIRQYVDAKRYDVLFTGHYTGGFVDVYVNGVFVKRIDTYSQGTTYRKAVTVATYGTKAKRLLTLRVVGGHNRYARGSNVFFDAVRAVY